MVDEDAVVGAYVGHLTAHAAEALAEPHVVGRVIGRRFSLESIRKVFGRAALNDVRELGWAVRELIKESPREGKEPKAE